jgi:hypothetical protein
MWSAPQRVVEHNVNSYKLETLDGARLEGEYSARRLREFVPREGMELVEAQKVFMEKTKKEEEERRRKEIEDVVRLRRMDKEDVRRLQSDSQDWHAGAENIFQPNLFYEEEEVEEVEEIEGEGIAHRVSDRRRGRRHEGGGQME